MLRGIESQGMLLAGSDSERVVIMTRKALAPGSKVKSRKEHSLPLEPHSHEDAAKDSKPVFQGWVELGLRPVDCSGQSISRLKMESLFKPEVRRINYNINVLYSAESAVLCKRESLL